jgi:hypothetical protein
MAVTEGLSDRSAWRRQVGSRQGRTSTVSPVSLQAVDGKDFLVRVSRVFFLVGLFLSSILTLRIGESLALGDVLMALSALLLILAVSKPNVEHPSRIAVVVGGIFLISGGCLSTAVSDSPLDSLLILIRVTYVALILPWQTLKLLDTSSRLEQGLDAISLGTALCASATVIQAVLGASMFGGSATSAGRYSGLTGHVSDAGAISALAVVLGLSHYRKLGGKLYRLIMGGVAISGLIGLVLSGSVSGMLAAVVGVALLISINGATPKQILLFSIAAVPAWLIAGTVLINQNHALSPLERFYQVTGMRSGPGENTMALRFATDAVGFERFTQHPITGVGLDPEASIVLGKLSVHNFWLAALYQGGIFFALGLTIIVAPSLLAGWRARKLSMLCGATFASAVTAIVFALTAPSFFNRYFWLPVALLIAAIGVTRNEKVLNTVDRSTGQ